MVPFTLLLMLADNVGEFRISAFTLLLRVADNLGVSYFKGRLILQILAKIIKIYSDFGGRLICWSTYTQKYTV